MTSKIIPIHEEIRRILDAKSGDLLSAKDVKSLSKRRHPLTDGLRSIVGKKYWEPEDFDLKLMTQFDDKPGAKTTNPQKETWDALKRELLKLAASRGDIAYIAEAVCNHKHPLADAGLTDLPKSFLTRSIDILLDRIQSKKFSGKAEKQLIEDLLANPIVLSRFSASKRVTMIELLFKQSDATPNRRLEVRSIVAKNLLMPNRGFDLLPLDSEVFKQVFAYLLEDALPKEKGQHKSLLLQREAFLDWIISGSSKKSSPILEFDNWISVDMDVVIDFMKRLDPALGEVFHLRFVGPRLKAFDDTGTPPKGLSARGVTSLASWDSPTATTTIEGLSLQSLKQLAKTGIRAKGASESLLQRMFSSMEVLERQAQEAREVAEQFPEQLKNLSEEFEKVRASLEGKIKDLDLTIAEDRKKRSTAIQAEIEIGRFEAMKQFCEVHRRLLRATKLVDTSPGPFVDALDYSTRALAQLGIEMIGQIGATVRCDLGIHLSRAADGEPVEISEVGYIMTASRQVVLKAVANQLKER